MKPRLLQKIPPLSAGPKEPLATSYVLNSSEPQEGRDQ